MSFISTIESWFQHEASAALTFLRPIISAYVSNLEKVGIKDVEAFLIEVAPLALQAGVTAVAGGLAGVAVRDAVTAALEPVAIKHGADITHDLLKSILNTTAELQHQSQMAGTVPLV